MLSVRKWMVEWVLPLVMTFLVPGLALPLYLLVGSGRSAADAPAELVAESGARDLATMLEAVRVEHDLPALAALVVTSEGVWAEGYTGTLARNRTERVGPEQRFHLGSCTKSMTATLAALAIEREELTWATTLGEVFPDRELLPAWRAVTLAQLLSHTAGAPGDLSGFAGLDLWLRLAPDDLRAKRLRVLDAVTAVAPEFAPGSEARYSNIGYMLAGSMLEARADQDFEALMTARLFEPLGMASAGFGPPARATQPEGHNAAGKPMGELDNPAALGPAGTAHATLRDWAKYVGVHLSGLRVARGLEAAPSASEGAEPAADGDAETALLGAQRWTELHSVQPGTDAMGGYALGWAVTERPWSSGPISTHSGSNTMWFCVVWMAPAEDFAVLVACNQGGPKPQRACDQVAGALIGMVAEARND